MDKIFRVPSPAAEATSPADTAETYVRLRRQHLWISADLAKEAFGGERQIYAVYYDNLGSLLLAPMSDTMFKQAHECALVMLKDRNLAGDKSLSMQEIIIDNELDDSDRELDYTAAPGLQMLQVKLKG